MYYYDYYKMPGVREICTAVKQTENKELREMAISAMATYFTDKIITNHDGFEKSIIIPIPQHTGEADYTKEIAERVGEVSGSIVLDILKTEPRDSFYCTKKKDASDEFEFNVPSVAPILEAENCFGADTMPEIYLLDNVIATGKTFKKALTCLSELVPTPDFSKDLSTYSLVEKIARSALFRYIKPLVYGIDTTSLSLAMARDLQLSCITTFPKDGVVLYSDNC